MSLTVRFCGAARTVTGSCHLFEFEGRRALVDCGMFQGQKTLKALNYGAFPFRPADLADSDDCGRVIRLNAAMRSD